MKFLMESADEWAVVNHPWQPHVQHLHVLAAPLLVFACGLLWKNHVLEKMRGDGSQGPGHRPRSRIPMSSPWYCPAT